MYYIVTDNTGRVTYMYDCSNLTEEQVAELRANKDILLTEEGVPEGTGDLFFVSDKFERRIVEEVHTPEQYDYLVSRLVREKYSIDDELSLLRQRDEKVEEFEEYDAYVEACKERAESLTMSTR